MLIETALLLCFAQQSRIPTEAQVGHYRAKIAPEDGTDLPRDPLVMVQPAMRTGCKIHQIFGNGTVLYSAWTYQPETTTDECLVEIRLDGFRTKRATLHDGAVVALKRLGEGEGSMTPASSINAPKAAAKVYAKGVEALRKGKWAEAQELLQKAVDLYPDYAQAQSDLGEALERQAKIAEAQAAYENALRLSPKYLKPYAQLARLAISQGNPEQALTITDRAIRLNPVDFPSIYYYRALACQRLHRLQAGEESVRQAIELDVDHQLPRALFLLAMILEEKGDRAGAIRAFEQYAGQSPKPADAGEVGERIARLKAGGR